MTIKGQKEDTTGILNPNMYKTETVVHTANIGDITLNIFPNPTGGKFIVELDGWNKEAKAELQLYTLSGTEIKQVRKLKHETNIDITSQPNGTYILTIIINGRKEI